MSRIVALIAARMGSSRLPGKALMPIDEVPMLGRMIERIRRSDRIDQVVLATTEREEDEPLVEFSAAMGIGCHRGSPDDVLGRITGAAKAYDADTVLQLLGDNPLLSSELVDAVIQYFETGDFDYAVNVTAEFPHAPTNLRRFAIGIRAEVMSIDALRRCEARADTPHYREHATSYIADHPEVFKIGYLEASGLWQHLNHPEWTFAVNYQNNFDLIAELFARCGRGGSVFPLQNVVDTLAGDPKLVNLMGPPG